MILTFSELSFVQNIITGTKIHTIRSDKLNRWHPGRDIHFWYRNPRNVKVGPYSFGNGVCRWVDKIDIRYLGNRIEVKVNDKILPEPHLHLLAINDGFENVESFRQWFVGDFTGKIIHWKDTKFTHF